MDAAYLCSIQHRLNHYGLLLLHTRTNEKRSNKNGAVNKFLKMELQEELSNKERME